MTLPKLGSGGRFKVLKEKLAIKGAKSPGALAAFIGRKKYGSKKMADLSAKGKKAKDPVLADAADMGNKYKANTTKIKKSHYAKI